MNCRMVSFRRQWCNLRVQSCRLIGSSVFLDERLPAYDSRCDESLPNLNKVYAVDIRTHRSWVTTNYSDKPKCGGRHLQGRQYFGLLSSLGSLVAQRELTLHNDPPRCCSQNKVQAVMLKSGLTNSSTQKSTDIGPCGCIDDLSFH